MAAKKKTTAPKKAPAKTTKASNKNINMYFCIIHYPWIQVLLIDKDSHAKCT